MAEQTGKDAKEERIRALTKIYYSNPKLQQYLLEFGQNREVVPRYYEGFGKRPDMIQYPSDIQGLVMRGATSLHCSEELWHDPLQLQSTMSPGEMSDLRKSWDLLIDIDSPFLDFSKVACQLVCQALEDQGIKEYGIKYSGSKGFHVIVSGEAFPEEFMGQKRSESFPQWPRAIVGYLMTIIKPEYGRKLKAMDINLQALQLRTKLTEADVTEFLCPNCGAQVEQTLKVTLECDDCGTIVERPNMKLTNRVLRCTNCPGVFKVVNQEPYFMCQKCGTKSVDLRHSDSGKAVVLSRAAKEQQRQYSVDFEKTIAGEKVGEFDMVLVAPRHLFRMPYSLHEKTSLASVVIDKTQIAGFTPKDAQPLGVELKPFIKAPKPDCGTELLRRAMEWKAAQEAQLMQEYNNAAQQPGANRVPVSKNKEYAQRDYSHLTENDFPQSIKKLLKGLDDGKKRGLFVLITFVRSIGWTKEKTDLLVRQWNEKNKVPLREGYVRSQVEWHYKQRKQILPPNYENDAFYKDIGLVDKRPAAKNPLSEIASKARFKQG